MAPFRFHFYFLSFLSFISCPPFLLSPFFLCVVVIGCLVVAIVGKARGNAFVARCRGHQHHGVAQQQEELQWQECCQLALQQQQLHKRGKGNSGTIKCHYHCHLPMKLSKPFRFKEGLASLGGSKGSKEVQNKRVEGVQFGPSFLFFDVIYQTQKLSFGPIQTCHVFFGHFSKK